MKNETQLFKDFEGMINKFAWRYFRAGGDAADFNHYKSEAQWIFVKACRNYDASKGAFSTHLYNKLRTLSNQAEADRRRLRREEYISDSCSNLESRQEKAFHQDELYGKDDPNFAQKEYHAYLKAMPRDARLMALWYQAGMLEPPSDSHEKKHQLLKPWSIYLRKAKKAGWDWPRTQKAFEELQNYMRLFRDSIDPYLLQNRATA